jgi:hypothetical protein
MSQQTINDLLENSNELQKKIDELQKKIGNNRRIIENKLDIDGNELSENDKQFNLLTSSIKIKGEGYSASYIKISNIDIENQDLSSLQHLYDVTLEKYNNEQFKIFGHNNDITGKEWYEKCKDKNIDPDKIFMFSKLKLLLLEQYYYLFVKPNIIGKTNKYIYLTECKNDNIEYYNSDAEAFGSGCNRNNLPPVVFTSKV